MHIIRFSAFAASSVTTTSSVLRVTRSFLSQQAFTTRVSFRRNMSSGGERSQTKFPEVISTAISSLDTNVPTFMSTELRKLYGGTPDEDLIKNQVENYYMPMFGYLKLLLDLKSKTSGYATDEGPLFIGISAPQGCGKTTMTDMIRAVFAEEGKRAVALSLDDFYLTGHEQEQLAASEKTEGKPNELLKLRGNAGTHDLSLLNNTLADLKAMKKDLRLPRYDKSLRGGKGDRAPTSAWDLVNDEVGGNVDIVLFEGWMLGFHPVEDLNVADHGDMVAVNKYLEGPGYAKLHGTFDAWIVIALEDINYVYDWRLDAEKRMINSGKPGMSDDDVRDFVNRFMPAYQAYLPRLHEGGMGPQPRKPWMLSDIESKHHEVLRSLTPLISPREFIVAPVLKVSIDKKRLPKDIALI